jgi:hypothetical protein
MLKSFIIIPFDKFHTLVFESEIVIVFGKVSPGNSTYTSVIINNNAMQTIQLLSEFVIAVEIEIFESPGKAVAN